MIIAYALPAVGPTIEIHPMMFVVGMVASGLLFIYCINFLRKHPK